MSEAEQQIIQLLTDIRDFQIENRKAGERAIEETVDLQKKAVKIAGIAAVVGGVVLVAAISFLVWLFTRLPPRFH